MRAQVREQFLASLLAGGGSSHLGYDIGRGQAPNSSCSAEEPYPQPNRPPPSKMGLLGSKVMDGSVHACVRTGNE